ncbi:MAG: ribosome maturation factor RimM [Methylovulum sp.]|uniref:ribosome maturation factor RimM n=1 Tax=Methylovulum sp. TaxID=1916980 RepID=UPI002602BB3C|nr:ribosome maturation factor RimM [Methylovulum sp.]MDD2723555.1 ribosome maturation factor RimM [Methylovulum sp.]
MPDKELINVGEISGVFGIKGWVKVFSYTDKRENILRYAPWLLKKADETKTVNVLEGALQGGAVVARLDGINDRDQAAALMGWTIFIRFGQLPKTAEDEYYWSDLIGLTVETVEGIPLGNVENLLETGANDVVIVKGERDRAIPFLQGQTIIRIDLPSQKMIVDWDPDF